MKFRTIYVSAATAVAFTVVTWGYAQQSQPPSRPPGISEENWIPISDSVGIVVRAIRTGEMLYGTGVVMALYQDQWLVFEELTVADLRAHPLK